MEVRYEDLDERQQPALEKSADFLQHDLNYDRIQETSVGSVKKPLTSFNEDLKGGHFTPVGRWRDRFPADQLTQFEKLIGHYLPELGYPLSDPANGAANYIALH